MFLVKYDAIKKKIEEKLQAIGNVSNETDELAKRIEVSKGRVDGLCIRLAVLSTQFINILVGRPPQPCRFLRYFGVLLTQDVATR